MPLRKHTRGSVTCFRSPHCCSRGPSNVLPEFLNWPLVKKELGGGPVKSHSESQTGCIWNKCPVPVFRVHITLVRAFLIISAHCSLTKRPTGPLFIDTFFLGFYVFAHLLCCQMPASNPTLVTAYWRSSHDKAQGFLGGSEGRGSACNVGDSGSTPGLERPPEEGNGNPL